MKVRYCQQCEQLGIQNKLADFLIRGNIRDIITGHMVGYRGYVCLDHLEKLRLNKENKISITPVAKDHSGWDEPDDNDY